LCEYRIRNRFRLGDGSKAFNGFAVTTNQEFREIPFDAIAQHSRRGSRQPLKQGMGIAAIYIDFGEHGEGDAVIDLTGLGDLRRITRFLPTKLIAREPEDDKTLVFVGLIEVFQTGILRRKAALAGSVYHQYYLFAVVGHGQGLPPKGIGGERIEWAHTRTFCVDEPRLHACRYLIKRQQQATGSHRVLIGRGGFIQGFYLDIAIKSLSPFGLYL
jgi:hypothetical protein